MIVWRQYGPYALISSDAMFKVVRNSFKDRIFKFCLMHADSLGVYKKLGKFETAKQAQQAAEDYSETP